MAGAGPSSARAAPAGRAIPFGGAIQSEYVAGDPRYAAAFLDHCDLVMPMNELKFDQLRPARDVFRFAPADDLVAFALSNGKLTRGTTHAWWNATPPWVEAISDAREAERVLVDHIERVTDRYRGKLEGWDVVNEVIANDPLQEGPMRRTTWLRLLGPRHIPIAFRATQRADPSARLTINDYDLEFKGPRYDARRAIMLTIVRQLQEAGIPVGGVGIQGHLYGEREIDIDALTRFSKDLDALGVKVLVTELDVINRETGPEPEVMDALAMRMVGDLLDGLFAWTPPAAVIAWGITDRYSWVPDVLPRYDGTPHRPLPLDTVYRPKPWLAMVKDRLAAAA